MLEAVEPVGFGVLGVLGVLGLLGVAGAVGLELAEPVGLSVPAGVLGVSGALGVLGVLGVLDVLDGLGAAEEELLALLGSELCEGCAWACAASCCFAIATKSALSLSGIAVTSTLVPQSL